MHASSALATRDRRTAPSEVLCVDMRPLVLHLLAGLQRAGIERVVIVVGENAKQIANAALEANFRLMISFVHVPSSLWRTLANSIMVSRAAFPSDDPFLIVRADQLYDWRLLRRVAGFELSEGVDASALIDTAEIALHWASGALCTATCKNGRRAYFTTISPPPPPSLPLSLLLSESQVDRAGGDRILSCGHRVEAYDAVVAGDVYVTSPKIFAALERLAESSIYYTTSEAMQLFASGGSLGWVEVGELDCHWFGSKTVIAAFRKLHRSKGEGGGGWRAGGKGGGGGEGKGSRSKGWMHVVNAAIDLLHSSGVEGDGGTERWPPSSLLLPLLKLGRKIGQGANCEVWEAKVGQSEVSPAMGWPAAADLPSRLAVKVYHTGHTSDRGKGAVMRDVMWEVHVLRQIRHENIVRLCDVVEFVDAVFVVMECYEGPDLLTHITSQPGGVLAERPATTFLCHLLAALRHAHSRGFLHCDLKPENVRLSAACDRAIVVDWGMSRAVDAPPAPITHGTPAYAPPEQLTGYSTEQAWGPTLLTPTADVWSLGATYYEMVVGCPPFSGGSFEELVVNVLKLDYTFPSHLGGEVVGLIRSMLQVCPCERASVKELCANEWLLSTGDLPAVLDLPTENHAYSQHIDRGRAGGHLHEVVRRWQRPLLGAFYAVVIGLILLWHSDAVDLDSSEHGAFQS
ncbi:MAG: hypothetical protein SGPRY_008299 [Prymnesium sp.]